MSSSFVDLNVSEHSSVGSVSILEDRHHLTLSTTQTVYSVALYLRLKHSQQLKLESVLSTCSSEKTPFILYIIAQKYMQHIYNHFHLFNSLETWQRFYSSIYNCTLLPLLTPFFYAFVLELFLKNFFKPTRIISLETGSFWYFKYTAFPPVKTDGSGLHCSLSLSLSHFSIFLSLSLSLNICYFVISYATCIHMDML